VTETDLSALVQAAQRGDEHAFRSLYRAVQPGLLRYLRGLVGDDAEDVASETWLQIARDLASFRRTEGFRAWAATIGRNRALDHLRHMRRRPATVTAIDDLAQLAGNDTTDEDAAALISTDAAVSLIASLPKDQAEAVLLRVVMGLDAKTAAKVLGKSAGAVRTAAYRGLHRLAQYLNELDASSGQNSADRHGPSPPAGLARCEPTSHRATLVTLALGPRPAAPRWPNPGWP
jgi:RNA polymerase sigma-70 factor (ECF subfamily)